MNEIGIPKFQSYVRVAPYLSERGVHGCYKVSSYTTQITLRIGV
jgi:hypothetical protein